jgi:hypothetical protein
MLNEISHKIVERLKLIENDILSNDKIIDKMKKKIYDGKHHNQEKSFNFVLIQKMILTEKKKILLDVLNYFK